MTRVCLCGLPKGQDSQGQPVTGICRCGLPEARPPVVMPPSILRTGGAARAAQPQKKVRLGEQEVRAMDSSDEYWQLKISLEKKIVASWNLVELDGREAQRQALLLQKVGKNGPHYLVTDSGSGHVALLDTAESLFEKHRELLGEVRFLWALVETLRLSFAGS